MEYKLLGDGRSIFYKKLKLVWKVTLFKPTPIQYSNFLFLFLKNKLTLNLKLNILFYNLIIVLELLLAVVNINHIFKGSINIACEYMVLVLGKLNAQVLLGLINKIGSKKINTVMEGDFYSFFRIFTTSNYVFVWIGYI